VISYQRPASALYFAPNTDAGFLDAVAASLHATPPPDCVSISWGAPESNWTQQARNAMEAVFAQLVAKGIPVFAASGDGGSADGTGGRRHGLSGERTARDRLRRYGSFGERTTITAEVAWPGSGGGVSKVFPPPPFSRARTRGSRGARHFG